MFMSYDPDRVQGVQGVQGVQKVQGVQEVQEVQIRSIRLIRGRKKKTYPRWEEHCPLANERAVKKVSRGAYRHPRPE